MQEAHHVSTVMYLCLLLLVLAAQTTNLITESVDGLVACMQLYAHTHTLRDHTAVCTQVTHYENGSHTS